MLKNLFSSKTAKRIAELTNKSLAIAEMGEKLNALFAVPKETVNTGVGRIIENLLTNKL